MSFQYLLLHILSQKIPPRKPYGKFCAAGQIIFALNAGKIYPKKCKRKRTANAVLGADYEARTRYLHLGKVALYQMS